MRKAVVGTLFALVLVFTTLIVFMVGIYLFSWSNAAAVRFAQVVPLPAALVAGHNVRLSQYYERLQAYEKTVRYQSGSLAYDLILQKNQILGALVSERMVRDIFETQNLTVTRSEIDRYYRYVLSRLGISPDAAGDLFGQMFGWTEEQFKRQLVVPELRLQKLQAWFHGDRTNRQQYQDALAVRGLLTGESPLAFAEAAILYSDDEDSKYLGGNVGFSKINELDPWVSDAVSALDEGELSEVVITPEGYKLIELAGHDDSTDPGELNLRQILIKGADFDAYLAVEKQKYRVYIFGKF